MVEDEVWLRVLGPVQLRDAAGEWRSPAGPQLRLVLAFLALADGQVVPAGDLVDVLWEDRPPPSARASLQILITRLRKALAGVPECMIERYGEGYQLHLSPGLADVHVFRSLVAAARQARDDQDAIAVLNQALMLWRGPAVADVPGTMRGESLRSGLAEEHLSAVQDRFGRLLAAGRDTEAAAEIPFMLARHPLAERLAGMLMTAWYRSGRQAEALQVFRDLRDRLVRELGVEPGDELQRLHQRMLSGDPALARPADPTGALLRVGDPAGSAGVVSPDGTAPLLLDRQLSQKRTATGNGTEGTAGGSVVDARPGRGSRTVHQQASTRHAAGALAQLGSWQGARSQLQVPGLQPEFPLLRSQANPVVPNNLPAQLATFVGRDQELSDVRTLVESSRLVTLTGAGGAGKTRLSLQVAAGLLDGSGDGVWLVELAAVADEDAVAPAIAAVPGIAGQPGRPTLEVLLDALAPQDAVIVLDNCEHLIGACAKTADAILRRCPRVRVIATSREPLRIGGEIIYRVPSLSLPGPGDSGSAGAPESSDAVALLLERAWQQGVELALDEQTAPLVVSICRRLDGMPLAIELAAARLRSLSLSSLRDRLDQRFLLLTGGSRAVLERQRTLQATVDWSYSLLKGTERLLLRRLSVFAESFGLDAAEEVCGFGEIEEAEVARLLGSLVDKSLVQPEPAGGASRYRLLETIREFAEERLAETGEQETAAVAAAHGEHFLRVAEAAAPHLTGPEQGSWFARLDADQPNLRRAAEHAAGRPGGTAWVLRIGVALLRYWAARSRDAEALALLGPALRRPEARADPRLFTAALVAATFVAHWIDNEIARQFGEQAVALARQLGDDRLLVESLTAHCATCYLAGQPETALQVGREAVERARQLGDDVLLGGSLMVFLMSCYRLDPARFGPLFTEAVACTNRSGDQFIAYHLHDNASVDALYTGDIPAARAQLEAAGRAVEAIGQKNPILSVNLGWVLRQESDHAAARSTFEAALRVSRRIGHCMGIAYASLGLACLAGDLGDWHHAAVLHGVAQARLDRMGEPWQDPEARYRRDSLRQIRAQLGDDQLEPTYAHGMGLTPDDALDLALDRASLSS